MISKRTYSLVSNRHKFSLLIMDKRSKIDGYSRGELAQLARRKMLQQVKPSKKKYKRKNRSNDKESI